jgi:hypothetical protein
LDKVALEQFFSKYLAFLKCVIIPPIPDVLLNLGTFLQNKFTHRGAWEQKYLHIFQSSLS